MRTMAILGLVVVSALLAACGGGRGGGGGGGSCADLSLGECREAIGCVPDVCEDCDCTPTYRGCVPDGVAPSPCPLYECPSPLCCGATDTCTNGTGCAPPGSEPGCGTCNSEPGNCTSDAECKPMGATLVCDPIACSCDGARACVAGCVADADCDEGLACDTASARCVPQACAAGASDACPPNFDCVQDGCMRHECSDDSACDDYCVLGRCYAARGTCTPPVP